MSFPIRFPGGQTKGLVKRPEGKPLSIWRNPIMQLCPKMNGHPMASFRKQVIMKKKKNIENSNNSCGVCISFYYQSTKDDFPIKDESSLWILEYIGCHKGIPRCIFRYFKGSPHIFDHYRDEVLSFTVIFDKSGTRPEWMLFFKFATTSTVAFFLLLPTLPLCWVPL